MLEKFIKGKENQSLKKNILWAKYLFAKEMANAKKPNDWANRKTVAHTLNTLPLRGQSIRIQDWNSGT